MTMTLDTKELIAPTLPIAAKPARERGPKRKAADPAAARLARARNTIEKLEEQNDKAATALQEMSALWLSPDGNRRRSEALMALNHFNDALTTFRKAIAAT